MTQLPYYSDDSSSPSGESVQPATLTPPHVYKAILPNVVEEDLDSYISSYKDDSLKYVCNYPVCKGRRDSKTKQHLSIAVFTSKSNARNHVRRDMNIVDAFKCSCGQTFSSEDSAKRHCNTKSAGKVHECPECGHGFERKDYWEVHVKEKKCRRANRITPPQQLPPPPPSSSSHSHSHSPSHSHSHPHSPAELQHHSFHVRSTHYSPPQYTTHLGLIDMHPAAPSSPLSYNHYNNSSYHHSSPQCGVMQMHYSSTHMDYGMHHNHSHHHANAYASCSASYY